MPFGAADGPDPRRKYLCPYCNEPVRIWGAPGRGRVMVSLYKEKCAVKITVQPTEALSFNAETGATDAMGGMRVEWQEKLGGSRKHADIIMDSTEPAAMLRAAAAYFESVTLPGQR